MEYKQREQEILNAALDIFQKTTGIPVTVQPEPDGVVLIRNIPFKFVVQTNLRRVHVAAIVHELTNDPLKWMIITRYVTPPLADYLRQQDIAFIDTAGNAYVNEPPVYIFIRGNKPEVDFTPNLRYRIFQPAGLKLIFAFLCNPGLETQPYRTIAGKATVALGTVNWVMKDLIQMGYLLELGQQGRRLLKKKELLNRWVTAYPEGLRPKQTLGRYHAKDKDWWKNITFPTDTNYNTYWGGEIAAMKLTGYLKPMIVTIYTKELPGKIVLKYRLTKDPEGEVELLKPFWDFEHNFQNRGIVPPILVYADLIATGDPRNIETARIVYDRELTGLIGEN
jgi:hypothetical protein